RTAGPHAGGGGARGSRDSEARADGQPGATRVAGLLLAVAGRSAGVDSPVVRPPRARRASPVLHPARRGEGVRLQLRPAPRNAAQSGDRAGRRRPSPAVAARLTTAAPVAYQTGTALSRSLALRRPLAAPDPLESSRTLAFSLHEFR